MPSDYLETEKFCQQRLSQKNHFINDFIDHKVDIFISHKEHADYKPILKLHYNRIITTPSNPFK